MSDSLSFTAARDDIMGVFLTAWTAGALEAQIFYEDTGRAPLESSGQADFEFDTNKGGNPRTWIYATVQHYTGRQTTIGNGLRRFERTGAFRAEIYTARGTGLSLSDAACKVVADAFEGQKSPSGIWFRNVRMDEIGPDGVWFRVDVIAEFRYDERK